MHVAGLSAQGNGHPYPSARRPKMDPQALIEQYMEVQDQVMKNTSRAVHVQEWK